jgi:hypothetical protein
MKNKTMKDIKKRFLLMHGFVHYSKVVNIDGVEKMIDQKLDKVGIPKSREDAKEWVKEKSKLQGHPEILSLINRGKAERIIEEVFGEFEKAKSSQIAYRFPGEGKEGVPHIDNYTEKDLHRSRIPPDFDLLVGIALNDTLDENRGNFTVFPGSHYQVEGYSRKNGGIGFFSKHGLSDMLSKTTFHPQHQLLLEKGDLLIVNRSLLHLICSPNQSDQIRKMIFFRVRRSSHSFDRTRDVWSGWKFKENLFLDDPFNGSGYGYRASETRYYLRTFLSQPNLFASSLILDLKDHTLRTNGFLSKTAERRLSKLIFKARDPVLIGKYIYDLNYATLIKEWFPDHHQNFLHLKFDHIKSKSKSEMIKEWADELGLKGLLIKGKPGFLYVEGERIELFKKRFECLYWNKRPQELDEKIKIEDGFEIKN